MAKKGKKEASDSLASALKKKKKDMKQEDSSDIVLNSVKKSQGDLQSMLKGVSEGTDYYKREAKEEGKIEPKLSYESKNKIAEDYLMENIPISERKPIKSRTPITDSVDLRIENNETESKETQEKLDQNESEKLITTDAISTKVNVYEKLGAFFEEFMKNYNERYVRWEESVSNILSILRKMRKYTKKNTEDLISSINNLYNKIQTNLDQFKIKRDEVEKIASVDILGMSGEFKKVLGLLELQIKEYQLKKLTDEFIHSSEP